MSLNNEGVLGGVNKDSQEFHHVIFKDFHRGYRDIFIQPFSVSTKVREESDGETTVLVSVLVTPGTVP